MLATGALLAGLSTLVAASPALAATPNSPARTWSTNGRVLTILPIGDDVYVGGTFSQVVDTSGHTTPAPNIALFHPSDGTFDAGFNASTNDAVNALALSGGRLYLGGAFNTVDGANNRRNIAAVDAASGALISSWHPTAGGMVDGLAVVGGNVYASGNFDSVTDDTGTYNQSFVARFDATSGLFDQGWTPAPDDRVRAVIGSQDGSRIFLGGDFRHVNGNGTANTTASLVTSTGAVDTTFRPGNNNGTNHAIVYFLATDGTRLIEAVGGSGGSCTAQNATTGATLWAHHTNGNLQSVQIIGNTAYCGGHFGGSGSFDGLDRDKLAAVTISTGAIQAFAPVVNSALGIWSLGADGSTLYAGGDFTKISGINQSFFAEFVDTADMTAPLVPRNLEAEPSDGAVFLSWDPPTFDGGSKLKNYAVYRATGNGTSKKIGTSKTASFSDSSAVNGTTYTYKVNAINAIGTSGFSNSATATPQGGLVTVPSAPRNLAATGLAGQIRVTWDPPVNDGHSPVTNYQILRSTSTGSESLYMTVGNVTSFVDNGAVVGTRYFYEVTAVNSAGPSNPSNESSAVANSGAPFSPTLTGQVQGHGISLSWNYPNDNGSPITKFVILRDSVRLTNVSGSTLTFTDNSVSAGTTYRYQVRAVNAIGSSSPSNTVMLTAQ